MVLLLLVQTVVGILALVDSGYHHKIFLAALTIVVLESVERMIMMFAFAVRQVALHFLVVLGYSIMKVQEIATALAERLIIGTSIGHRVCSHTQLRIRTAESIGTNTRLHRHYLCRV